MHSLLSRGGAEPLDLSDAQLLISEGTFDEYFDVAFMTLLVYHTFISMNKEVCEFRVSISFSSLSISGQVKYFWLNPRSSVSLVFFLNRFLGLLASVSTLVCKVTAWIFLISNSAIFILIDYILAIRVIAIYDQDRRLNICLKTLLGIEAVAGLSLLIYSELRQQPTAAQIPGLTPVCAVFSDPPLAVVIISALAPLLYGLILLILALYKAAEYWRLSARFTDFRLVRVVVQDQVLYYGAVIFICVLKIVNLPLTDSSPLVSEILYVASNTIFLCVLGGQLLVNLKEEGENGVSDGTSRTISEIEFSFQGTYFEFNFVISEE
ncbi:hypothetical protein ACEPAG_2272 [Sanghuangporus baumii]